MAIFNITGSGQGRRQMALIQSALSSGASMATGIDSTIPMFAIFTPRNLQGGVGAGARNINGLTWTKGTAGTGTTVTLSIGDSAGADAAGVVSFTAMIIG